MRLAIIGSGSGAFAAAIYAAGKGAKVTMIEKATTGGTCVNVGCVPSKIFIRAALVAHTQQAHPFPGLASQAPAVQRSVLLKQQQARVEELRFAKYESILASTPNITFIHGFASFKDKNTLKVTTDTEELVVEADRILIATGSSPMIPAIPGLSETPFWTSTTALQSDQLPEHLVVLGGSVVAVELAQAFSRLGSKVTLLARSTLLSKEDPQIGVGLKEVFEKEGIQVVLGTVPKQVTHTGKHFVIETDSGPINADRLMVSTGRSANTKKLALETCGVQLDSSGRILVDEQMRTNVDTIFAAGDCTTQPQYVYVAAAAGTRAAVNMLGGHAALDLSIVPAVTFTDPQVATVGLTEEEAIRQHIEAESRTLSLDNIPRALVNFETQGFIKLVAEKSTGRLLGAQILASEGGETIQTVAIALRNNMTINQLSKQLFPYLTMVEGLKLCAQIFTKDVKKLSCCADTYVEDEEIPAVKKASEQGGLSGQSASITPLWKASRSSAQPLSPQSEPVIPLPGVGVSTDEAAKEKKHSCCK